MLSYYPSCTPRTGNWPRDRNKLFWAMIPIFPSILCSRHISYLGNFVPLWQKFPWLHNSFWYEGTESAINILTHANWITSAIITVMMVKKPPSSTKTGCFLKDLDYQILCSFIVLWRWNLEKYSCQEAMHMVSTKKHLYFTLRVNNLSHWRTWVKDDMVMVVEWWLKEIRKLTFGVMHPPP